MLKETLSKIAPMDRATLDQIVTLFTPAEFKKRYFLAKKGEFSTKIAFVQSGVLRAYYSNEKGEEYNKTFFTSGNFVGAYSSLVTKQQNRIDIDCLTDCTLLVAEYKKIVALYEQYPKVERLSRILAEQFFVRKRKARNRTRNSGGQRPLCYLSARTSRFRTTYPTISHRIVFGRKPYAVE